MTVQPTTPAPEPRSRVLAASCDRHLVDLMLEASPQTPVDVRVVEIREANYDHTCKCRVPAQWLIRTHGPTSA